jgi:hypothetical protein
VEHLWEEIREKWFENLVFGSLDAVEDRLEEALRRLESDRPQVASLTAFDWMVSSFLNAT